MGKTYPLTIEGFTGQTIEMVPPGLLSPAKLLVNGAPAPKGPKMGQMLLRRADGREVVAKWKLQMLGTDIPNLEVDGKVIRIVPPLKWYEFTWAGIPILLLFIGGAVGGGVGAVGTIMNVKIFRSSMPAIAKYFLALLVFAMAMLLWLIIVTLIVSANPSLQ